MHSKTSQSQRSTVFRWVKRCCYKVKRLCYFSLNIFCRLFRNSVLQVSFSWNTLQSMLLQWLQRDVLSASTADHYKTKSNQPNKRKKSIHRIQIRSLQGVMLRSLYKRILLAYGKVCQTFYIFCHYICILLNFLLFCISGLNTTLKTFNTGPQCQRYSFQN